MLRDRIERWAEERWRGTTLVGRFYCLEEPADRKAFIDFLEEVVRGVNNTQTDTPQGVAVSTVREDVFESPSRVGGYVPGPCPRCEAGSDEAH